MSAAVSTAVCHLRPFSPQRPMASLLAVPAAAEAVLAFMAARPNFHPMNAVDVIQQIRTLPRREVVKVREWLLEHEPESPEFLAAIDEGLQALERDGAHEVTRAQLEHKVRQWAGG
jgi:sirohydrochlorin ferrochelatase